LQAYFVVMAVGHLQQFLVVFALLQQGATQDQSEGGCQDKSVGAALLQKLSSQGSTVAKEDVAPENVLGGAAAEDSTVNDGKEVGTANAGAGIDKAVVPVRILEGLLSDQVPDVVMEKMHDYTIRQKVNNGAKINNEATINKAELIEPDLRHVQTGYQQEGSYYEGLNLAPMGSPYEGLPLLAHRNAKNHNAETTPWWTLQRSTPWMDLSNPQNSFVESNDVENNDAQRDNLAHLHAASRNANNSNAQNQSAVNNNMEIKEEENHDAENSNVEANEAKNISAMPSNEETMATTNPTKKKAVAVADLPKRQKSEEITHMQIHKAVHTESFDADNHNIQESDKQDEVWAAESEKAHAAEEAYGKKPVSIEQMLHGKKPASIEPSFHGKRPTVNNDILSLHMASNAAEKQSSAPRRNKVGPNIDDSDN